MVYTCKALLYLEASQSQSHSHKHSHADVLIRCWILEPTFHQRKFGVQCFAQGHFNKLNSFFWIQVWSQVELQVVKEQLCCSGLISEVHQITERGKTISLAWDPVSVSVSGTGKEMWTRILDHKILSPDFWLLISVLQKLSLQQTHRVTFRKLQHSQVTIKFIVLPWKNAVVTWFTGLDSSHLKPFFSSVLVDIVGRGDIKPYSTTMKFQKINQFNKII